MKYRRRFKDEFIVHFDADVVEHNGVTLLVFGTAGIDVDNNKIQIRDDIMIKPVGNAKPFSFEKILLIWDSIHGQLIYIAKKKMLVHRRIT